MQPFCNRLASWNFNDSGAKLEAAHTRAPAAGGAPGQARPGPAGRPAMASSYSLIPEWWWIFVLIVAFEVGRLRPHAVRALALAALSGSCADHACGALGGCRRH